jgi:hypothetical protein
MVNIMLAVAGFLAFITIIEACGGWYQYKYSDGSHCCVRSQKYSYLMRIIYYFSQVVEASLGSGYCPDYCNGGDAWPPECISQTTGDWRRLYIIVVK